MNFNLFTPQKGFQSNLPDASTQIGVQQGATKPNNAREAFKTDHARNNTNGDKEKFADIMQGLKKRNEAQRSQNKDKSEESTKTGANDDTKSTPEKALFQTQETALIAEESEILVLNANGPDGESLSIDLSKLDDFGGDLQKLIEEQTGLETSDFKILSTGSENEESVGVFALLVTFKVEGGEETASNTDQISAEGFLNLLKQMIYSQDNPTIESDLTPQQLTELQAIIQKAFDGELDEEDMAILSNLTGPIIVIAPIVENKAKTETNEKTILPIIADAPDIKVDEKHFSETRYDGRYELKGTAGDDALLSTDIDDTSPEFKAALKEAGLKLDSAQAATTPSAGEKFLSTTSPLASAFPLTTTVQDSAIALTAQTAQSPGQTIATNIITQSQSAAHTHPATQLVSASIQKAVKGGENTDIKLQLDPPELGRVEVKMSIDKDNATKLVLTAEKPETFLMLQKDSDALQRALMNAGLDADSGDLSFELANDDHEFNNPRDNSNSNQRHNKNAAADEALIETTMDWHVDPDTGMMRYNVLV